VLGYKDGKPVFDTPARPAPREPQPAPASTARSASTSAPAPAPTRSASTSGPERKNQFPGECSLCGTGVAKEAGLLERVDGRWKVRHRPGDPACKKAPAVKADTPTLAPSVPARGPVCTPDGKEPSKGYFTAEFEHEGQQVHVTLRLKRQKDDDRFKPGRLLVSYLMGSNNEGDYQKFGDIDEQGRCWIWAKHRDNVKLRRAVAAVLGDQKTAGEAWARESERCWRCAQHLTTPWALDHLMGRDCWEQMYDGQ
jgi:hypothetical protein